MKITPLLSFCLIGAPVLSSCTLSQKAEHKPNIMLILADDMGWGDMNANGNSIIEAPALNKLVNESLSFDRFYVCPLSAPTRSEMLTGRYFLRTHIFA
jgi:arylsulfatase A-like enzyme